MRMRMQMQMQLSQHVAVGRSYFVAIRYCHCHCHLHCSCMGTTASTTFFQLNYPASRDVCGIWKSQESQAAKSCRRYWIATRGRGRGKRNLNIESFRQLKVSLNSWNRNLIPTVSVSQYLPALPRVLHISTLFASHKHKTHPNSTWH